MARAERTSKHQQVILPYTIKSLRQFGRKTMPIAVKILEPSEQGFIVIGTKIVQVFEQEEIVESLGNSCQSGNFAVRKNVFRHPGIDTCTLVVKTDGMQ